MDIEVNQSLIDRLCRAAELWSAATGRTLGALSAVVTNQGSFFARLGDSRNRTTTVTLEKFAVFLANPDHWPRDEGCEEGAQARTSTDKTLIPEEVLEFCEAVLGTDVEGDDGHSPHSPFETKALRAEGAGIARAAT